MARAQHATRAVAPRLAPVGRRRGGRCAPAPVSNPLLLAVLKPLLGPLPAASRAAVHALVWALLLSQALHPAALARALPDLATPQARQALRRVRRGRGRTVRRSAALPPLAACGRLAPRAARRSPPGPGEHPLPALGQLHPRRALARPGAAACLECPALPLAQQAVHAHRVRLARPPPRAVAGGPTGATGSPTAAFRTSPSSAVWSAGGRCDRWPTRSAGGRLTGSADRPAAPPKWATWPAPCARLPRLRSLPRTSAARARAPRSPLCWAVACPCIRRLYWGRPIGRAAPGHALPCGPPYAGTNIREWGAGGVSFEGQVRRRGACWPPERRTKLVTARDGRASRRGR